MGNAATSDPVEYPFPYPTVFAALERILPYTRIHVASADAATGHIKGRRPKSRLWGEYVDIYVWAPRPDVTVVKVHSRIKTGKAAADWGANERNHQEVFDALSTALWPGTAAVHPAPPPPGRPSPSA